MSNIYLKVDKNAYRILKHDVFVNLHAQTCPPFIPLGPSKVTTSQGQDPGHIVVNTDVI